MRRVLIVGPCGAGKSVLAVRLGSILKLPVVHLDAINWGPGWVDTPRELWRAKLTRVVSGDRWIIDGNYGGSLDIRLPRADTIICLDMPRWLCMWRVIRRVTRYAGRTRPDMGPGCPERLDWQFLEYVWNFHAEHRPRLMRQLSALPRDKRLLVLRSPRDVEEFMTGIRAPENFSQNMLTVGAATRYL